MQSDDVLTLVQELAEVTRLIEVEDFDSAMRRFVSRVVQTVPGCDHAMITARSRGRVETVAGQTGTALDETTPGPTIEAATFKEPRRLEDTQTDQRWPTFSAYLAGAGYRSALALPLATVADETAVFTLFSAQPGQFADTSYDIVLLFALHAGVVFDNMALYHDSKKLVAQLQEALLTRSTVGQAQGILMHRFAYDAEQAFAALRRSSQNNNMKLRDLAGTLITAHDEGNFDQVLRQFAISA